MYSTKKMLKLKKNKKMFAVLKKRYNFVRKITRKSKKEMYKYLKKNQMLYWMANISALNFFNGQNWDVSKLSHQFIKK
jgi:hypothetical protein